MTSAPTFGRSREPPQQPSNRLLTPRDLPAKGVCFHINHLRRLWTAEPPLFPRPFHLSPRRIAWRESSIDEWIEARSKQNCDEAS
jgi:hypothetical protein